MTELFGKFHLLLLHLPIGFLLLLAALEWMALRPGGKELAAANRFILLLLIPVTIASVICGWLLAASGGYDAQTLFWHRWLGTAIAVAVIALWIVRQRGWMTVYRRSLVLTLILLMVASHFGGTLTHGSDFLAWPKTRTKTPIAGTTVAIGDHPVYETVIQPIFTEYCVSCHGETKSKGGLRMDTVEHLRNGGDSGSLFDAPVAEQSLLGNRLRLPEDDDDHMPPAGKPQLTEAEMTIVIWWLNSGAPTDQTTLNHLNPPTEVLAAIQTTRGIAPAARNAN